MVSIHVSFKANNDVFVSVGHGLVSLLKWNVAIYNSVQRPIMPMSLTITPMTEFLTHPRRLL